MYRNISNIKKAALICLFLMIFPSIVPNTLAAGGSAIIHLANSKTIDIGKWELPRPLDDYFIEFYAIPSFKGNNAVSWSTDRDSISPGETLSLTTNLEEGKYDYRMDFRVVVKEKSTGKTKIDKTKGIDVGETDVPGSYLSPPIPIIIPLELIGIPAELIITFRLSTSTNYLISLSTYGLDPQTESLKYSSSTSMTSRFSKSSGLGSEIYLTSAGVEVQGNIIVSVRLGVTGVPKSFEKELGSVPIGEWVEIIPQDVKMVLLHERTTETEPEPSFLDKIPGFPYESILLGLIIGALLLFLCTHKYGQKFFEFRFGTPISSGYSSPALLLQ